MELKFLPLQNSTLGNLSSVKLEGQIYCTKTA